MQEPGGLSELGAAGSKAWDELLGRVLGKGGASRSGRFSPAGPGSGAKLSAIDWSASPSRVITCLTRQRALSFLDHPIVGRNSQEEYCEWRVVRRSSDKAIARVELTTELAAYWRALAVHEPQRTLELVAEFAGRETVPAEEVYELADPDAATPEERDLGFAQNMLAVATAGPFNSGALAICCLIQETNTLEALMRLAISASRPRLVRDERGRSLLPTADQLVPPVDAQLGRSSDPVLIERFGRLAYEGRQVGFNDPLGIYIASVEHSRLRCPDGSAVPPEWFALSRGLSASESPDGRPRYQRLVFEAPAETGLVIGELIDSATEQRIEHGAQVAELVQLVLYLSLGPDARHPRPQMITPDANAGLVPCAEIRRAAVAAEASEGAP